MHNFPEIAAERLEQLLDEIEEFDQESKLDIDLIDNILSITLLDDQEYIINRHQPSQQIWLSSPISGAGYFSYDAAQKQWQNKYGQEIGQFIIAELS